MLLLYLAKPFISCEAPPPPFAFLEGWGTPHSLSRLQVPSELCSEGLLIGGPSALLLAWAALAFGFRTIGLSIPSPIWRGGTYIYSGGLRLFSTLRQALVLRLLRDRTFCAFGALCGRSFSTEKKIRTKTLGCSGPFRFASPELISQSVSHA